MLSLKCIAVAVKMEIFGVRDLYVVKAWTWWQTGKLCVTYSIWLHTVYDYMVAWETTTRKELDRENRKTRKRIESKTYSVLYPPWEFLISYFFPFSFLFWRTYWILGRLRISFPSLSGAECLLQRRWMQLKVTDFWLDSVFVWHNCVQPVRLYVLTVSQCLNLLSKTSKIRMSESILSWCTLLSLKLETHRDKGSISIYIIF